MKRPDLSLSFIYQLRKYRKLRGFTQAKLAQKAILPATAISHYERGARLPDFNSLVMLCYALQVSADTLLGIKINKQQGHA